MELGRLAAFLNESLDVEDFVRTDISLNGLQVGDTGAEVRKVAFAVDACMASFKAAYEAGADALVVHHGLFWGHPLCVTGVHYERIRFLIEHKMGLYACHLPLDSHPVYGNNAQMARILGLEDVESFAEFRGKLIGMKGRFPKPLSVVEVAEKLGFARDAEYLKLEFGKKLCSTVGLVSGSAADDVHEAISEGLDLFVTGESEHPVFHECEENHMNMLCLGHYATETYGVKALMGLVAEKGLETVFVDVPTGL